MHKPSSRVFKHRPVQAVLALLYGPHVAATWSRRPAVDFALEEGLVRQTGIADQQINVLIRAGYLERTRPVLADERSSCHRSGLVLTAAGAAVAERLLDLTLSSVRDNSRERADAPNLPSWNSESRDLSYCGQVLRHFERTAPTQMPLLDAFEEQGWPEQLEIASSLGGAGFTKTQIRKALENLSREQNPKLLSFSLSLDGRRMCWRPLKGES